MIGSIGGPELFLILIIALIVFGPRKLPDIGKSLGKMMGEFRRASNDFKRTIEDEVEAERAAEAAIAAPAALPPAVPPEGAVAQTSSLPDPTPSTVVTPETPRELEPESTSRS